MTRLLFVSAAMFVAASSASAQDMYTKATGAARKAAAATDAHIAAEQRPDAPAPSAPSPAPTSRIVASAAAPARSDTKSSTTAPVQPAAATPADSASPPPLVLRESFAYEPDGRRDPFVSLLTTNELRPTMSDLRLTGILYDQSGGRHSVATLRDVSTNQQYRVTAGTALGRMRVAAIGVKRVLFTIDEFGTTRQDSLVLGDSTKARAK